MGTEEAVSVRILVGDCLERLRTLPEESVHCVVTSPPYWGLRDYGVEGAIGLEPTFEELLETLVTVFREVRRVLRKDGTLWLNYGDRYATHLFTRQGKQRNVCQPPTDWAGTELGGRRRSKHVKVTHQSATGLKPKDLMMMPARVALALQADGWWLRSEIVWHKSNPMPESVRDRPTSAHEKLFLLTKSARYFYDAEAVRTKTGANLRNVWTIPTHGYPDAHFATFPPKLVEPCIKAGCPVGGVVLDPFGGSGTVGLIASRLGRDAILIELNPEYAEMAERRIHGDAPLLADVGVSA